MSCSVGLYTDSANCGGEFARPYTGSSYLSKFVAISRYINFKCDKSSHVVLQVFVQGKRFGVVGYIMDSVAPYQHGYPAAKTANISFFN